MAQWETCIPGLSYIRANGDGTLTLLVVPVSPKLRPAYDGGEWTEPEVWKVTVPDGGPGDTFFMWDKPHRITWMIDPIPAQTLSVERWPYRGNVERAQAALADTYPQVTEFNAI